MPQRLKSSCKPSACSATRDYNEEKPDEAANFGHSPCVGPVCGTAANRRCSDDDYDYHRYRDDDAKHDNYDHRNGYRHGNVDVDLDQYRHERYDEHYRNEHDSNQSCSVQSK